MATGFTNIEMLDGWLAYLQQLDMVGAIVGRSKQNIMSSLDRFSFGEREEDYGLECPLLGEAVTDLILAYDTKNFIAGGTFKGRAERFNHFFELYARLVGPQKRFELELDTAIGVGTQIAVFLDIEDRAEQVIAKTLAYQGEARRLPSMQKLLAIAENLQPKTMGFVLSHASLPFRFSFSANKASDLLDFVQRIEANRQSRAFQRAVEHSEQLRELQANDALTKDLQAMARFDFLQCQVSVDVMSDGRIGPIYGLDLKLKTDAVEAQKQLLSTANFGEFIGALQNMQVLDSRINCVDKAIFSAPLPKEVGAQESLYSKLAGFKLRYKQGKRLPAKIFIQGNRG